MGSANTAPSGTISPSPFHQPPPARAIQQQQQQVFSLAVGGHRSAGAPFLSSQQQPMALPVQKSTSTSSIPACSICPESVEAACRCDDCAEYLCAKCVQAHLRVRLTKDHRIIPLFQPSLLQGQVTSAHSPASTAQSISSFWSISNSPTAGQQARAGSSQPSVAAKQQPSMAGAQKATPTLITRQSSAGFCAQHQFEPMTFYCETCSEPLCRFCTSNNANHPFPSHRISSITAKHSASGAEKASLQSDAAPLTQVSQFLFVS